MTYEEHLREAYNEGVRDSSLEIAKRMLRMGESFDYINRYLKISEEEFQKLKEELSKESNS